jgi:hypothetical protein
MRHSGWLWGLGIASVLVLAGCGSKVQPGTGGQGGEGGEGAGSGQGGGGQGGSNPGACVNAERMDILIAVDNSRGMADKQQVLAQSIPEFVGVLLNPACVDDSGALPPFYPATPLDPCPAGTKRAFAPMFDVHIGVIDSSLGGHGSDSCPDVDPTSKECSPSPNTTNNDKGHLLSRLTPCGGGSVPTYQSKGFLAWDPTMKLMPPGETKVDDGMGGGLIPGLRNMVLGAGQIGCGYESQLESVYRFLVDPQPYQSIQVVDNAATPMGVDSVLLQQRAEFLRPDSLLAVIMLSDENDCSTKEYGQFYYINQLRVGATSVRMPRARKECTTNPDDACCKSCGQSAGNCPADPACTDAQGQVALYTAEEDSINLRCWDQKRRFGIDFLYPIDRYQQAFTSAQIANRAGELVPNPIFSDLNPSDNITKIRGPEKVLITGIVGVPWQDIARDKTDATKGFKTAKELAEPLSASGYNAWDAILGNPALYVAPKDPLMIESVQKRSGTNPITGDVLVDASKPLANPINGNERTIANDDLQYACIFSLPPGAEHDCTDPNQTACECIEPGNDNPLCQKDPNNNNAATLQVRAKAYPGIRQLSLLRALGDQATVGSVCAPQVTDQSRADFSYRPALHAVVDWLDRRSCY